MLSILPRNFRLRVVEPPTYRHHTTTQRGEDKGQLSVFLSGWKSHCLEEKPHILLKREARTVAFCPAAQHQQSRIYQWLKLSKTRKDTLQRIFYCKSHANRLVLRVRLNPMDTGWHQNSSNEKRLPSLQGQTRGVWFRAHLRRRTEFRYSACHLPPGSCGASRSRWKCGHPAHIPSDLLWPKREVNFNCEANCTGVISALIGKSNHRAWCWKDSR